jgi:hypothetical protein
MSGNSSQVTPTRTKDASDRPISLVDATRPREPENVQDRRRTSRSPSWRNIAKRTTKDSMREGLARWKYSKWQQDRYASTFNVDGQRGEGASGPPASPTASSQLMQQEEIGHTDTSDFALRQESQERGRNLVKKTKEGAPKPKAEKQPCEIDILYENQRGWFFFGIPLYSHSSLLNFDPSPWITKDGKDSAVNITNAQLPDPSWDWAWNSWYVDMSYDVDEEGWQYSFSFSRKFSWHGTHPWFHCFVRRRRWLRKRVKKHEIGMEDGMNVTAEHMLTSDYFTIHTNRARSPASAFDEVTTRGSSRVGRRTTKEIYLPPEEIKDIPSLLKSLRRAMIDREKIDVVKRFVDAGGEELVYLEEYVPDIMGFFVFQASRRELLEYFHRAANQATTAQGSNGAQDKRIDHLRHAIRAADKQIGGLEYWSDRQHALTTVDEYRRGHRPMFSESSDMTGPKDNNPVDDIKGIAGEAEVGVDPTKTIFSPPPRSGLDPSHVDTPRGSDMEEVKNDTEGSKTPRSLPHESVKADD